VFGFELERSGVVREIGAQELEARNARGHREGAGAIDGFGIVAPEQIEHSVERSQRGGTAVLNELIGKGPATGAGAADAGGELLDLDRRLSATV
jgi:hypothetical protein